MFIVPEAPTEKLPLLVIVAAPALNTVVLPLVMVNVEPDVSDVPAVNDPPPLTVNVVPDVMADTPLTEPPLLIAKVVDGLINAPALTTPPELTINDLQ